MTKLSKLSFVIDGIARKHSFEGQINPFYIQRHDWAKFLACSSFKAFREPISTSLKDLVDVAYLFQDHIVGNQTFDCCVED